LRTLSLTIEEEDMSDKELEKVKEMPIVNQTRDVVALAIEKGASMETLEKMMALQERYEANEARKAYHVSMSEFKSNPPKIIKDAHVKYSTSKGTTDYKHATLANITSTISSELSKYGLSATWHTEQIDKLIKVMCKITHINGHSESTSLSAAPDESGGKNTIQAIGSTVTYLERYTLLAATGLATCESDDDGAASEASFITEKQIVELDELIREVDADYEKFIKFMGVEKLGQIKSCDFAKAKAGLEAKKKGGNK
jgi:hypothetical protein